jgi:hypothetical protein
MCERCENPSKRELLTILHRCQVPQCIHKFREDRLMSGHITEMHRPRAFPMLSTAIDNQYRTLSRIIETYTNMAGPVSVIC